jgi:hypothetical protein
VDVDNKIGDMIQFEYLYRIVLNRKLKRIGNMFLV